MTIPSTMIRQVDFSAGQLDGEMARSDDLDLQRAGAKAMSDISILSTRGFGRRPGSNVLFNASSPIDLTKPVPGTEVEFVFEANTIKFYDGSTLQQTLAGFPWGAGILTELRWVAFGRFIIVVHKTHIPQVVEYDADAGTWSRSDFAFRQSGGNESMPFLRFLAFGETLLPSALTGTGITVTFSAEVLTNDHIGVLFRYAGRQLRITGVTSGLIGTADVIDDLPPTHIMGTPAAGAAAGFRIGDILEGLTSGAKAELVGINGAGTVLTLVLIENYAGFVGGEVVVGPEHRMTPPQPSSGVTPIAASKNWEEAFMSPARGWPGAVSYDRSRLIFSGFDQAPTAIVWSAIDAFDDMEPGANASDGIFEFAPGEKRVVHVSGGADQFVFTDETVFYIPISESNPLAPGSVAFRRIGSGGAADVPPVPTNQGVVYLSSKKTRINAVRPTGQTSRPYQIVNVSRFHSDLIKTPIAIAADPAENETAGEFIYVVNSDGTLAIGRFDPVNEFVGFVPWTHTGSVKWVSARLDRVLFAVEYGFGAPAVTTIEEIGPTAITDGQIVVPEIGLTLADYANQTMSVVRDGQYDGEVTLDGAGVVPVTVGSGEVVTVGFNFRPRFVPFAQNFAGGESFKQRTRLRKIRRAMVTVRNTRGGWRVNRDKVASYRFGENEELAAPERDRTYSFKPLGRSHDPEIEIVQDVPGAMTVIEVTRDMTS